MLDRKRETSEVIVEYKIIAKRVARLQQMYGWTNAKMAQFLGVTQDHYSKKLKTGRQPFTLERLIILSRAFDIQYIFTGEFRKDGMDLTLNNPEIQLETLIATLVKLPDNELKGFIGKIAGNMGIY